MEVATGAGEMSTKVTCYGGVGEIGGNKILLEDRGTKVFLDFGTGFAEGSDYFDSWIKPRGVNGAGDLFEFGVLPEIQGLYSEPSLQNTGLKYASPEIDAVVLSHYHWDHAGRIGYVDPKIPVYCGKTTALIHEAYRVTGGSALKGHELRTFRTGDRFSVGGIDFQPVHVDHSIPGAYGFVIYTSSGPLAYTGDFRFHGPAGEMTEDFVRAATESRPAVLLSEGTRVGEGKDAGVNTSESEVLSEARRMVKESKKLVFSTFRGNDTDRINTFDRAARASGRTLVVSMKTAVMLEALSKDGKLTVPRVGKDVGVYVRRKKSGSLDDSDYYAWERRFLDEGLDAQEVRKRQGEIFLHLETSNFPELIDIKPERGGTYIHSATEAFNEEGEREDALVRNWVDHLGFSYHQLHASGHAPMEEVARLVNRIRPKRVVPIHTEEPDRFDTFSNGTVDVPAKGTAIPV